MVRWSRMGIALLVYSGAGSVPAAAATSTETILFIRHGEKGPSGLGQLSCRGLNRALALPAMLVTRYGSIGAVFVPDPSHAKQDGALSYDYVRPIATVEPAAVRFGLPVHAAIGYEEGAKLRGALVAPEFRTQTVLVAWEHHAMNELVPALVVSLGGDRAAIPKWAQGDFDSIWRVTIAWDGETGKASFAHDHQGLDGQPDICPNAAAPPLDHTSPIMLEHK